MDDRPTSRAPPRRPRTPHQKRADKIKPPAKKKSHPSPQQKLDADKRLDEYRQRQEDAKWFAKEKKRPKVDGKIDKQRYYPLLLWDSEVVKITTLADEAGDDSDKVLIGRPWEKWIGEQGAKIICNALRVSRPKRG